MIRDNLRIGAAIMIVGCINITMTTVTLFPRIARAAFLDPMNTPAIANSNPTGQQLLAITRSGNELVSAGLRGVVLVSNSNGEEWTQAAVPVQSDLVAVQFPNAIDGWACGHDGVVLHTSNGGLTWTKQLDGLKARGEFENYYNGEIASGNTGLSTLLTQIQLNYDSGPSLPWLGVWFQDNKTGYVVGSFGDIATTSNGGETWRPWLDHIDNPNFLDLNALGNVGGQLYIVGEQGTVYVYMPSQQKFVLRSTGYAGSLFGLTGTARTLIVFGMRGTIFRSENQGKTWTQSSNPSGSTIMNGMVLPDGRIALVDVDGDVIVSSDDGKTFRIVQRTADMPLSDINVTEGGKLVLTGLGGIRLGTIAAGSSAWTPSITK
jgi:photosystem II stability/assembly factor-like uncharacterized protein